MANKSEQSVTWQDIIARSDFELQQMSKRIAALTKIERAMREDYFTMMDKIYLIHSGLKKDNAQSTITIAQMEREFGLENLLERISELSKIIKVMREEEFAALNLAFYCNAIAKKDNEIAQKDNEIAQKDDDLQKILAEISELKQKFELN